MTISTGVLHGLGWKWNNEYDNILLNIIFILILIKNDQNNFKFFLADTWRKTMNCDYCLYGTISKMKGRC